MQIRMQLQPASKEENQIATEILRRTDRPRYQCLAHDAAIPYLFPKLDLRTVFHEDGSMSSPIDTFEAAWQVLWLKVQEKGLHTTNRLRYNRVEQLVRFLGHAQMGEVIAGVGPEDILNSRLMTPGPLCRIYGWTFRLDEEIFDPPSIDEYELMFAMMVQGGQYFDGNAWLDKAPAWEFLRRSGLDNDTLALIWNLVDWREYGRLTRMDVVRMLRLISCAQRGVRLHTELFERCQPISRHLGCLLSPILRPSIPLPSSPTSPTSPTSTFITLPSYPLPSPSPRTTHSSPVLRPSNPLPPPSVLRTSSPTPLHPAVPAFPLPQLPNLPFSPSVPRASSPLPSLPAAGYIPTSQAIPEMADLSACTLPSSNPQEATILAATGEETTLPLTEYDIARLKTTLERVKPQDEVVSTFEPHRRLSGPRLHVKIHGQILDMGNADHSGSVAQAEMADIFSQFMSELRLDIPDWRQNQLREDAARVHGPHNGDVNPTPVDTVESPADSGGFDVPDSMSALMQSPLTRRPPPWRLNVDHPSQQEALQRNKSTNGLTHGSNLQNPSNHPVSPAPQLVPFSTNVLQTSPQSVDRNPHPPNSPELLSNENLPSPPYELEDNQPQMLPQPVSQRIQIDRPDTSERYHQILTPQFWEEGTTQCPSPACQGPR